MSLIKSVCFGMLAYLRHFYSISALSLTVLVLQSSFLVVLTHYSMESSRLDQTYYVSVLILHQEILKLMMCLVVVAVYDFRKVLFAELSSSHQREDCRSDVFQVPIFHKDKKMDTVCFQNHGNSSSALNVLSSPLDDIEIHGGDFTFQSSEAKKSVIIVDDVDYSAKRDTPDGIEPNFKTDSPSYAHYTIKHHRHLKNVARVTKFLSVYYRCLYSIIFTRDTLKLLVPAVLFTGQNLLIFVGLRHLDPVSFQIWSQVKLLSAALFSVWMLDRHLSWMQWGSLALLTVGILLTQLKGTGSQSTSVGVSKVDYAPRAFEDTSSEKSMIYGTLIGIVSCLISGISSSYAGVYFEKVVKTTKATLAVRNLQLSIFAIPLAILSILVLEVLPNWSHQRACGQTVQWNIFVRCRDPPPLFSWGTSKVNGTSCPTKPFFIWQGFASWLTWSLVFIHALGGMLVAVVMRYADNIQKGFATGLAVILSGVMSSVLWGYSPSRNFAIGALLVIVSIIVFHKFELKRK